MHPRAAALIESLGLDPHPEGGYYRETFRSPRRVDDAGLFGRERPALTAIHFLLASGNHSRWHRLRSDEIWVHLEGEPVRLWRLDPGREEPEEILLGPLATGAEPVAAIPAGAWQAAEPTGPFVLVDCFVAPGFTFEDLEYMDPGSPEGVRLRALDPGLARLF